MSTVISKTLNIAEATVEQYCTADGLSLNTGGYAIRLYLNDGKTGYAIVNDAGKAVLYPTATAHPIKADSSIRASRSAGTMSVNLQFGGTNVHSESFSSTSLKTKELTGITDASVTGSTRSTVIQWQVNGSSTVSNFRVSTTDLTLYFNEYTMSANAGTGANGIKSVSTSAPVAYDGDTITFSAALYTGAVWDGWYSDAACTSLVSSDLNYSVSPNTDVTLYAKATLDAALYNCTAVAGAEIASVSVSESIVADGNDCTFIAQPNEGCAFNGWYSDSACSVLVSSSNPYTAVITSDTTLYTKAIRSNVHLSVGTAEHGMATVSATTVAYGSNVTYRFTPEDETWELYGWYSDAALTQLVSEDNPYTFAAKADTTLYPMVGKKRYTIRFGRDSDTLYGGNFQIDAIAVYFDQLTRDEIAYLRSGGYDKISVEKVTDQKSVSGSNIFSAHWESITCTRDEYVAFYSPARTTVTTNLISWFEDANGNALTHWPFYWFQPTKDTVISTNAKSETVWCICDAIAKVGIDYAYATTPTRQKYEAIFEAEVTDGYIFDGWYSDEACTALVSTDNPARVVTPEYTTETSQMTALTLYAKAIPTPTSTCSLSYKTSGTWYSMPNVYYKANGVWVEDSDACITQLSQCAKVRVIDNSLM